ncbi:TetR/AcrR family transcriptional regulator [Lentilactobacillus sp. SPB1-3]|uniref:TetR/AcrR family transcriptional regulator n=1 Tax=Lentilactobacillus terminaliae TaxID=3003483 RepID=A0ACD5DDL1_9LACO|nr:TetR/AcrR family transcriptional regulator [Lentilactobacillus sp. SPB1-3]MCZ0977718.1 TetR/AcrR family transcriptional regulator [Lentilactobacillus sp. SPB1-3]
MDTESSSKEWIAQALLILLRDKPLDKITVTEITKKAGVARLTFYRNFDSKEDVIQYQSNQLFKQYLNELQQSQSAMTLEAILKTSFAYWQDGEETLQVMIKNDLLPMLEQSFRQYLAALVASFPEFNQFTHVQQYFIIGGIVQVIIDWLSHGLKPSSDQVIKEILDMLNQDQIYRS